MSDINTEPPRAHARIVYLGPVSPHWEVYGDYGDRVLLDEFLKGYGWDVSDRELFASRALSTALLHDFDMFSEWRERIAGVRSLDELAFRLFAASN